MATARRYDAATIAPSGIRRDKRGFVEVPAYVTRVGVLTYKRADGTVVRELRHPDHVFHADSLQTLLSAPVCVGHPGAGLEWVTPDNAHQHEVGVVASARADGTFVDAHLSVRRADTIRRIDAKELIEVSAAYDADIDPTPGTWNGQPYDQVQTNITYNHVALLPRGKGRAGPEVCLRADSADAVISDVDQRDEGGETPSSVQSNGADTQPSEGETTMQMRKLRVDGIEYELPETAAGVLEKAIVDRDKYLSERDAEKKRADSAEAVRDQLQADLQKAKDPANMSALVQARVTLERDAARVLGTDKPLTSLSDRQVREAVLEQTSPEFTREGRSDDAITAAFEYALANAPKTNLGLRAVTAALSAAPAQQPRADSAEDQVNQRLAELEKLRQDAWKGAK